ncbi:MAG: DTW domain-containing protein [Proteobacteria bacterium]|nr:DTW domain-containing protein [Pseudomonadota bacterium]
MGGRRNKRATRCIGCRMHTERCICDHIPSVASRANWVVVQHRSEGHKTTNTGRLAALGIADAQVATFHSRIGPLDPPPTITAPAWVLFPSDDAVGPETLPTDGPVTLVVPDGTWPQARKIARVDALRDLPRVGLPPEAMARWSLRDESRPGGMSTLDAVCWLLRAVDGAAVAEPLEALARTMFERTVASRGIRPPT